MRSHRLEIAARFTLKSSLERGDGGFGGEAWFLGGFVCF